MKPSLFQSSSVFWRVNREMTSALAGPRAVLMQIAHPLVAAGVADHSRYRDARFGRLYRTAMAAAAITFCSEDLAARAILSIDRKHRKVHGVLRRPAGVFPAGTPYDANDPELKLWVLATITDSTLLAYQLFVKPLSMMEREEFYQDSLLLSKLFGIPDSIIPQTYCDFQTYINNMLSGDIIQVSDSAREISNALFAPTLAGKAMYAGSIIGIGLMPDRLKQEFGLAWSPRSERWLTSGARIHRSVRKHVPSIFCASPVATYSELVAGFNRQFAVFFR